MLILKALTTIVEQCDAFLCNMAFLCRVPRDSGDRLVREVHQDTRLDSSLVHVQSG